MSDLVPVASALAGTGSKGSESAKRKFFASTCDAAATEFQSRAESIRTRLEALEQGMSGRRRPEEEYRLEKLVSESVHEKSVTRAVPAPPPLTVDHTLHRPREMGSVLGKRLESPQLMSLFPRQKRPVMSYELPRLDQNIRQMPNGTGPPGVILNGLHQPQHQAQQNQTSMPDASKSR